MNVILERGLEPLADAVVFAVNEPMMAMVKKNVILERGLELRQHRGRSGLGLHRLKRM